MIDYSSNLFKNVHESLSLPEPGENHLIKGDYDYWHYGCDSFDDRGWGCGYRTLQTMCSWIMRNTYWRERIPSIKTIQEILVNLEDKEQCFIGSRNWIGSFEVCLVLDQLYNVSSKIIHIRHGKELISHVDVIRNHFLEFASPIMMGGDEDCSSKCIVGIHIANENIFLLIIDPHFVGKPKNIAMLQNLEFVAWRNLNTFNQGSFYNLCLPQIKIIKN